ncbi:2-succinyl-5-enolpyruvyl-6-hydroxy-3-cyclohexene-1-carboxylic-acid synthase [Jeotgalibacillus marinus]|uniref:2-succinyl-5-enolpyruvyl-6-hydroxy-3-cyclohexene-1-carboxylate synthase n=1 Tax=Jeotgalibacillus marinus TaxID=86667 RepID=A0ABV3Q7H3_9BACL
MNHQQSLTTFVGTFIQQLIDGGVTKAVISPGSRSTPLAYLLQDHPLIDCHINVDERSAAFYALGMAKKIGDPVVLVCTSGTAAANYFPAIVEARYARVPLIVLTADRPHELRSVGAPQAIDQIHLFGNHVKWFADMTLPEDTKGVLQHVTRTAARAIAKSMESPCGPVHLNFPFREPLVPLLDQHTAYSTKPIRVYTGTKILREDDIQALTNRVNQVDEGLIVVGPMASNEASEAIIRLANKTGFPVLTDPLSHLRKELAQERVLIEGYDAFLKSDKVRQAVQPELVIRFGGAPVSKTLMQFLSSLKSSDQWLIDQGTEWRDPNSNMTDYIDCNEHVLIESMLPYLEEKSNRKWLTFWQQINEATVDQIALHTEQIHDEGTAVGRILNTFPPNSHVVVGNSMPIRDVDTFWTRSSNPLTVWANRGVNGIDGVVSTALGISSVTTEPVYLLIGDLSMFHDLNGLLVTKQHPNHLNIIILNNNGGGIFSYLPQGSQPRHFETLFGTPPTLDFKHAAALYEMPYKQIQLTNHVGREIQALSSTSGVTIAEVMTNRQDNVQAHRQLWDKVRETVEKIVEQRG